MHQLIHLDKEDYHISTDPAKVDLEVVHDYLCNHSYWNRGIPFETVKKAAEHSLNFSLFHHQKQIGYARVITDYCQIAYLGDVFILEPYRGQGLATWLIEAIHSHPNLQNLRNWLLGTKDAHNLYRKYGWENAIDPSRWMFRPNPEVYKKTLGH